MVDHFTIVNLSCTHVSILSRKKYSRK